MSFLSVCMLRIHVSTFVIIMRGNDQTSSCALNKASCASNIDWEYSYSLSTPPFPFTLSPSLLPSLPPSLPP